MNSIYKLFEKKKRIKSQESLKIPRQVLGYKLEIKYLHIINNNYNITITFLDEHELTVISNASEALKICANCSQKIQNWEVYSINNTNYNSIRQAKTLLETYNRKASMHKLLLKCSWALGSWAKRIHVLTILIYKGYTYKGSPLQATVN